MNRQDVHQPQTDTLYLLDTAATVGQTFFSSRPELNIVSVCLRNPARQLTPITFKLYDNSSRTEPLRTIEFNGGNVSEDDCTRLQFVPLTDSANKEYYLELSSPGFANPINPKNSMYIEVASDYNYPGGTAYVDGVPLAADLHFKTYYRQDLAEVAQESVTQFGSRLPQDLGFMLPYLLILGLVLARLFKR